MKSFIETQRALLAEIQNGCKRNFILAKEKEETEQKMRQSASMAEISTEDGTGEEEEEEPASEHGGEGEEQEAKSAENAGQTSSQPEASSDASVSQTNLESDSDTEDEEEEVVTKSCSASDSSTHSNQTTTTTIEAMVTQPPSGASHTTSSPSASPAAGQSVVSSITVMESSAPPGTPPSPGRCISVSSPGRGHKIFMVTRVESPPEQQQQLLQIRSPASPSLTIEASKKPADATTQVTPPASTQTLLTPPPSKDCKLTEQSPVAHVTSTPDTTQMHTLEPISKTPPTEHVTRSTLDPDVSVSTGLQVVVSQPCEEATESTTNPHCEQTGEQEGETDKGSIDDRQLTFPDSPEDKRCQSQATSPAVVAQQQPVPHNELACASEDALSPNQMEEEDKKELLSEEKQEAPQAEKPSLTEDDSGLNQLEARPKQQTAADEQGVDVVLSVQTNHQAPSVIIDPVEVSTDSLEEEESADDDSDEDECFAEALDGEVVSSALPNGLKPEFSRHLLEAESPKPGSCVMEHGKSLAFRICIQGSECNRVVC